MIELSCVDICFLVKVHSLHNLHAHYNSHITTVICCYLLSHYLKSDFPWPSSFTWNHIIIFSRCHQIFLYLEGMLIKDVFPPKIFLQCAHEESFVRKYILFWGWSLILTIAEATQCGCEMPVVLRSLIWRGKSWVVLFL